MRHPSSQALYAIWDETRGTERAPDRSDLPPEIMRELLGDIFMLGCNPGEQFPLRVAGTRVCALLGRDCQGTSLPDLFAPASRRDIAEIVVGVAEEVVVAVAGLTALGHDGTATPLELLLLPFRARAHSPASVLGLLVPMTASRPPLRLLSLSSWRYLGHAPENARPRVLRKTPLARGLTVYEGLR